MVVDEFIAMLVKVAMEEACSLEHFKQLAKKKWGYEIDGIMTYYLEDAYERSRALLPCVENQVNFRNFYKYVWTRRGNDVVHALMMEPILRACQNCEKTFPFSYNNLGLFCSRRCAMQHINKHKRETKIERLVREWLEVNDVEYEAQYRIDLPDARWTLVDFFVLPNYCVYVDGEYWHSKEHRIEADMFQNRELSKLGYVVMRLPGSRVLEGLRPVKLLELFQKNE